MANRLTSKQNIFCEEVASGKSQAGAYRVAYDVSSMKNESIWRKASELMNHGKVTARIDEIRKPVVEEARLTLGQHLNDLLTLREKAVENGVWSAAISAEMGRGRAAGLHITKVDLETDTTLTVKIIRFSELEET